MQIQKTDKLTLTPDEILKYIADYEAGPVREYDKLWEYYQGKNVAILSRKADNPNSPDNKVPIPYGRKIVTTFTGYAYRPNYITYKAIVQDEVKEEPPQKPTNGEVAQAVKKAAAPEELYMRELQATLSANNENIKTSRAGRNTGIFGVAYELLYIDKALDPKANIKAEPRFFSVDPRENILLYDYSSEPKKVMAIRFYKITTDKYKVEVYYANKALFYDRTRDEKGNWTLSTPAEAANFFDEVPVIAYYFDDEMTGILRPVLPLIDAYDVLISDSMNEYDKFAAAYLIMKNFGLTDPTKKKEPGVFSQILANMKRNRVFENVPKDAEISYLTKDIPTGFIEWMSNFVRDQIHVQSHVPDFTGEKMSGASGIAIQRLLFDFENVVSSAEADFDTGLKERIRLISLIYEKAGRAKGTQDMISISHKRNVPLDLGQFATTALTLKNAGFSRYLIADVLPDDIVPDVEQELKRQDEDAEGKIPDIEDVPPPQEPSPEFLANAEKMRLSMQDKGGQE